MCPKLTPSSTSSASSESSRSSTSTVRLEHSYCTTCKRPPAPSTPLSRCAKCKVTQYCCRGCQLADWKSHKKTCGKEPLRAGLLPIVKLPLTATNASFPAGFKWFNHPFFAAPPETGGINDLHTLTRYAVVYDINWGPVSWLCSQGRAICYSYLIDSYRVRMQEENGVFPGIFQNRGYKPTPHFREFLELAESRRCLPPWWHEDHLRICVNQATREDGGACIMRPVNSYELEDRYGDDGKDWRMVVTMLRRVAKAIYGCEARRPEDLHLYEKLPYVRENGQWKLMHPQTWPDGPH